MGALLYLHRQLRSFAGGYHEKTTVIAVVLLALVIGCAAGLVVNDAIEPSAAAYKGETFEHRCTSDFWEDMDEPSLSGSLGQQGWEMVAMTAVKTGLSGKCLQVIACYKRRVATGK